MVQARPDDPENQTPDQQIPDMIRVFLSSPGL
jgi:hypothetical protein